MHLTTSSSLFALLLLATPSFAYFSCCGVNAANKISSQTAITRTCCQTRFYFSDRTVSTIKHRNSRFANQCYLVCYVWGNRTTEGPTKGRFCQVLCCYSTCWWCQGLQWGMHKGEWLQCQFVTGDYDLDMSVRTRSIRGWMEKHGNRIVELDWWRCKHDWRACTRIQLDCENRGFWFTRRTSPKVWPSYLLLTL